MTREALSYLEPLEMQFFTALSPAVTDLRTPSSACAAAHQISAFELFCAYHLGIQEDGTYRFGNVHDVAKRFGVGAAVIRQSLEEFALRPDDLWTLKWDLSEAQVAIAVATWCRPARHRF